MGAKTTYDHPLSERIRGFLRLEQLFGLVSHTISNPSIWDSRTCLSGLIGIVEILSYSDMKEELVKELGRQLTAMLKLQENPKVDMSRLDKTLSQLKDVLAALRDDTYKPGQSLRKDGLVAAVKQRLSIPGGTCHVDLPAYSHWLSRRAEQRQRQLQHWFHDLQLLHQGVSLVLELIRHSVSPMEAYARGGFFQKDMSPSVACQMVRILLPADSELFPEISGDRHRFTVRFMKQDSTGTRPTQTDKDVNFEIQCCMI